MIPQHFLGESGKKNGSVLQLQTIDDPKVVTKLSSDVSKSNLMFVFY